ncbi:MAG: alpha/beta hydrolase, partial [Tissierellia bacterium]|nr:alpha/beta hydrolase [Tissierellia bacterium]
MVIKEYGREHDKKLLFLPGAFSNDSWYFPILELFGERWHTFVVIYDGYHEPYEKSFVGVEDSANKIVDFFKRRDIHGFDMVYGLSMGGAIA